MHPLFSKASALTERIIAAAIEVHRDKGPGLIESLYEWCLLKELGLRGLGCVSQKSIVIEYKGFTREEPLRFDLLVEDCVLVEAKAMETILPIHKAQLLSYMRLLDVPDWSADQFSRDESHRGSQSTDSSRSKPMTETKSRIDRRKQRKRRKEF